MAQIANITVKKNDGTTDVVYTAVVPSAGDRTPAIWRNQTVGTAAAHRPEFALKSFNSGDNKQRRVQVDAMYPTLATDSQGKVNAVDKVSMTVTFSIPKGMPDVDVNEAVSQLTNVLSSTLSKDSIKSGYAPT
jgi:hypothetical protein